MRFESHIHPGRPKRRATFWRGLLSGLAAALFAIGPSACAEPAERRPNVLLVTIDTLRADHLGSYGFPLETSPAIDALAARGVLFERAIATSSSTAPSHASIFTARYPRQHSIGYRNGDTRLVGGQTLAEILRSAGHATAAFVGNAVLNPRTGLDRGFDLYDAELPVAEANRPLVFERRAEATTRRALAWLAKAEDPFFLWVHYQDPHGPYDPPPGFKGRFETPAAADETPLAKLDTSLGHGGIPAYQVVEGLTKASEYRARYAEEIRYADHWVGKLLAHPRVQDALVVLTADHGESLGEADRFFMHGTTTLPAEAHVPIVVAAPGLMPRRISQTVSHVDILPTVLEWIGLTVPETSSGLALGPLLRGEANWPERVVFCDMGVEASAYGEGLVMQAGQSYSGRLRWRGGPTGPAEPGDVALDARLRPALMRYLETSVEMVEAAAPEVIDVERLRALGYVE